MMKYYAIKAKTKSGETIEQYAYNVPNYHLKGSNYDKEMEWFRHIACKRFLNKLKDEKSDIYCKHYSLEDIHFEGSFIELKEITKAMNTDKPFILIEPPQGHPMSHQCETNLNVYPKSKQLEMTKKEKSKLRGDGE